MLENFQGLCEAYRIECREAGLQPKQVAKADVDIFTGDYFLEDNDGNVVCCLSQDGFVVSIFHYTEIGNERQKN
tara:strand:+ start:773 stop:994 length:222 start_codon:yes stop_codon:yes gene_type:complete